MTVYPTGDPVPNASNVNFTAGQVVPHRAALMISTASWVTIQNTSPGPTNVVADLAGYFTA